MAKKNVLDLFFKVEDDKKETAKTPSATPTVDFAPSTFTPTSVSSIGQEDAEIKKQLADALEKANLEGYDYFEFAKALEAQTAIIPSEALRFQSSFAMANSMGVTVEKLLSSAQHYMDVLQSKQDEFSKALEQHTGNAVLSKEQSIKDLDTQMQAKAAEIQKITTEINQMQQNKTTLINEIGAAKAEIDKVRNNFTATLQVFTNRIGGDINKIKTYLQGGK
jgi:chromosome segregation ATPase